MQRAALTRALPQGRGSKASEGGSVGLNCSYVTELVNRWLPEKYPVLLTVCASRTNPDVPTHLGNLS